MTLSSIKNAINKEFAWHYRVVPKEFLGDDKVVLYIDKSHYTAQKIKELQVFFGKPIDFDLCDKEFIEKLLISNYRSNDISNVLHKGKNILEEIIIEASSLKSSDIHFEIYENTARVRFRIDGVLIEKKQLKYPIFLELVNMIKIESNLDITEKRLPQDGRAKVLDYDLRVSIIPTQFGEKVVIRILGKDASFLDIKELGFMENELEVYTRSVKKHSGIVLISGPTGSGKTTTLYSTMKMLNDVGKNIVTVEDPIEYILNGVNQTQLREDIGLNFSRALKSILRQDPDIIMIGEIRDQDTAEIAVRAALTGHLVLSTIHTNSALGILTRLADLGIPPFLISETLNLVLAQRLVRKLCPLCKEVASESDLGNYNFANKVKGSFKAVGCEHCHYTGYVGRVAIYEIIPISDHMRTQIKEVGNFENTINESLEIISLKNRALSLVNDGITSLKEVYPILL